MGLLKNIQRNRQRTKRERQRFLRDLQKETTKIKLERQKALQDIQKHRPSRNIDFSPSLSFGGCPIFARNQQLELESRDFDNNNIWGVRGIITLWITMTFCLTCIGVFVTSWLPLSMKFELLRFFFVIVGLVVGAYFYTRLKLPFRL